MFLKPYVLNNKMLSFYFLISSNTHLRNMTQGSTYATPDAPRTTAPGRSRVVSMSSRGTSSGGSCRATAVHGLDRRLRYHLPASASAGCSSILRARTPKTGVGGEVAAAVAAAVGRLVLPAAAPPPAPALAAPPFPFPPPPWPCGCISGSRTSRQRPDSNSA
ncbi:hypothetical protein Vafri_6250 [Volvox africanus]|uniref:Uncharacterized protein n=1 Tax=Volvox africanus TaxID=51714 RepID=A0A8J4AXL7_9CHLO|nr:hypothetical protein Vafri_6250 [Volvox africanus]